MEVKFNYIFSNTQEHGSARQPAFETAGTGNQEESKEQRINSFDEAPKKGYSRAAEEAMMDLKEVQSFLYMLIGSEIKVSDTSQSSGSAFDMSA